MFKYGCVSPHKASRRAFVGMLTAAFIWGINFVIVKDAISNWPIFPFLAIRFSVATLALLPFLIVELRKQTTDSFITNLSKKRGFYTGLVLFSAYALQTCGLKLTSASSAAFLTSLYLIFIPIFLLVTRRANATLIEWFAAIIALAGVYNLTRTEGQFIGLGNLLIILAAGCYALQILLVSTKNHTYFPILFTVVQMAVVALASMGIAVFEIFNEAVWYLPLSVLMAAIFTGVVATTLCYLIQTWSQQHLSVTQTSVLLTLEPVFATLAGNIVLKEPLSPNLLIGGGLILASVVISQLTSRNSNII